MTGITQITYLDTHKTVWAAYYLGQPLGHFADRSDAVWAIRMRRGY